MITSSPRVHLTVKCMHAAAQCMRGVWCMHFTRSPFVRFFTHSLSVPLRARSRAARATLARRSRDARAAGDGSGAIDKTELKVKVPV